MISGRVLRIFDWLRSNIEHEIETIGEARRFVRHQVDGLTASERLFLECALSDRAQMEEFHASFGGHLG